MSLFPARSSCSSWLCWCQPGPGGSASTGAERGREEIINSLCAYDSRLLLQPLSPVQVCSVVLHKRLQPVQTGETPFQALGNHWQSWKSWCAPSATLHMASSMGTELCQLGGCARNRGAWCPLLGCSSPRTQHGLAVHPLLPGRLPSHPLSCQGEQQGLHSLTFSNLCFKVKASPPTTALFQQSHVSCGLQQLAACYTA